MIFEEFFSEFATSINEVSSQSSPEVVQRLEFWCDAWWFHHHFCRHTNRRTWDPLDTRSNCLYRWNSRWIDPPICRHVSRIECHFGRNSRLAIVQLVMHRRPVHLNLHLLVLVLAYAKTMKQSKWWVLGWLMIWWLQKMTLIWLVAVAVVVLRLVKQPVREENRTKWWFVI